MKQILVKGAFLVLAVALLTTPWNRLMARVDE